MDHAKGTFAPDDEHRRRTVSACDGGFILVDVDGRVLWMDAATRERLNGGLQDLALPLAKPEGSAIECFIAPVEVTIKGKRVTLCAIQEMGAAREASDLIATLESVMADSASWFTRTVIDKLKALRHATQPVAAGPSDLEILSDREREVLGLICEGRSDVQMSDILGLSENTVRNHIAALYRKIGVNRRTAAIIWARERGITSRDALEPRHRRRPPSSRPDKSPY